MKIVWRPLGLDTLLKNPCILRHWLSVDQLKCRKSWQNWTVRRMINFYKDYLKQSLFIVFSFLFLGLYQDRRAATQQSSPPDSDYGSSTLSSETQIYDEVSLTGQTDTTWFTHWLFTHRTNTDTKQLETRMVLATDLRKVNDFNQKSLLKRCRFYLEIVYKCGCLAAKLKIIYVQNRKCQYNST